MNKAIIGAVACLVVGALPVSVALAEDDFPFDPDEPVTSFFDLGPIGETITAGAGVGLFEPFGGADIGFGGNASAEGGFAYYSPSIFGFQFAGSIVTGQSGPTGTAGSNLQSILPGPSTQSRDVFSVGGRFAESFYDVDFSLSGGIKRAIDSEGTSDFGLAGDHEKQLLVGGFNIGYAGFEFGGSVGVKDGGRLVDGDPLRSWAYDAGASYSVGAWTFGINYFRGEVEGIEDYSDDSPFIAYQAGVIYQVSPGVQAGISGIYETWEEEGGDQKDSVVGILGMRVGF